MNSILLKLKSFVLEYRFIGLHIINLVVVFQLMYFFKLFNIIPDDKNLILWDGGSYYPISQHGYNTGNINDLAFFPLFPYLWKFLHLNARAMAYLNFAMVLITAGWLYKRLKLNYKDLMLFLSIPTCMFFYIPYSEALFFVFGSIMLVGFQENNRWLRWIGLYGISINRAITLTFFPALIIAEILAFHRQTSSLKESIQRFFGNVVVSILGILTVALVQKVSMGRWFYFMEAQKAWSKVWRFPKIPFTDWDIDRLSWINTMAFTVGMIAGFLLLYYFIKWLRSAATTQPINQAYSISLAYLLTVTMVTAAFTVTNEWGTSIYSLHRYVFATPFFLFFGLTAFRNTHLSLKEQIIFSLGCFVLMSLFFGKVLGDNGHSFSFWKLEKLFLALTFVINAYISLSKSEYADKLFPYLYFVNLFVQAILFHDFISGRWVA